MSPRTERLLEVVYDGADKVLNLFTYRFEQMWTTLLEPVAPWYSDKMVTDLFWNPDGRVFALRLGAGKEETGVWSSAGERLRLIQMAASFGNQECHAGHPSVGVRLPDGNRFQGMIPPAATAPCIAIRKRGHFVKTLQELYEEGGVTAEQKLILETAIRERQNLLICGAAGTGKTTLANTCLDVMAETQDRIAILEEEVEELQCRAVDTIRLLSHEGVMTLRELLREVLRMNPTRIVVGEVRGAEALEFLKCLFSGHPGGLCTIHADSAEDSLDRLALLVREAVDMEARDLIVRAVDVVIHMAIKPDGTRLVQSMSEVSGVTKGQFKVKKLA